MFYFIEEHESIKGEKLDDYLNKGWFRLNQRIDKGSHFISSKNKHELLKVWELRYDVNSIGNHRSHNIIRKKNKNFRIEYSDQYDITVDDLFLYMNYYSSVSFETSPDIEYILSDNGKLDIFDTKCIRIYDGYDLIALGIFDMGVNSIASILNCYDPEYSKYSLGKYLMLLITDLMKEKNMKHYYPGYLMVGNPKFDYKLFLGKEAASYLHPELNWIPFKDEIMEYHQVAFEDLIQYLELYHEAHNKLLS